jgi:NTP pyrophosphatase (non-canonical NTP hydrolase)
MEKWIMNLTRLSESIHADNVAKGFYDDLEGKDLDLIVIQRLFLCITELTEAGEALRKKRLDLTLHPEFNPDKAYVFEANYKDKFQDELGDTMIRLLDLCGYLKIDINEWIQCKLAYNRTREYKHGKRF